MRSTLAASSAMSAGWRTGRSGRRLLRAKGSMVPSIPAGSWGNAVTVASDQRGGLALVFGRQLASNRLAARHARHG